jgi:hypothetical protein
VLQFVLPAAYGNANEDSPPVSADRHDVGEAEATSRAKIVH